MIWKQMLTELLTKHRKGGTVLGEAKEKNYVVLLYAFFIMMFIFYGVAYHFSIQFSLETRMAVSATALLIANLIARQFTKRGQA
jgi:hypothetical protein